MDYSEYKKLTADQKELYNFNLTKSIHKHAKETNGTVKDNKKEIDKLKLWRSTIIGGMFVINVVGVPLLIFYLTRR